MCLNNKSGLPHTPAKGRHRKKFIPEIKKNEVREHINKFPTVDSHYCRAQSQRKYLEASLNISTMYTLYKAIHDDPVSEAIYRQIFCTEFNLSFFKPKKDVCDKCALFEKIRHRTLKTIK